MPHYVAIIEDAGPDDVSLWFPDLPGCISGGDDVDEALENAPEAIAQTKALTLKSAFGDLDEAAFAALVESHAKKRQSAEAVEGLASFAEKRAAKWTPKT